MTDLNTRDSYGNTPLQHGLKCGKITLKIVEMLASAGTNLHTRNYEGRSVLHDAVKYSKLGISVVDLLLKHKGATVLHDVLKNPLVTLATITKLLEYGAYPDFRDKENCPPLAYCELSSLPPADKEAAEKLLIQYTLIENLGNDKLEQLESGSSLVDGDKILCLHFCQDVAKRNEWAAFRDSCIAEIISMAKLSVGSTSLLKLVTNRCYKRTNEAVCPFLVKEHLSRLALREYKVFKDIMLSVIEECDLEPLVTELNVL